MLAAEGIEIIPSYGGAELGKNFLLLEKMPDFGSEIFMGIMQMYINDGGVMKMELGFSQCCPVTGLEAMDTKGKQGIPFNMSKDFFTVRVAENLS